MIKKITGYTGMFLALLIVASGCDTVTQSEMNDDTALSATEAKRGGNGSGNAGPPATCQDAGDTGMTAVYVNQSVNGATIDFSEHDCDLAIYFDENAPKNAFVRNATVIQETGEGGSSTGLWNNGGNVTVSGSTFDTDFAGQHVPIRFDEGASGTISRNTLNGTHRAGIVVRGEGTSADIRGNSVTGSGAKSSGWAENGIQIDQGATVEVVNNEITGHWWDGELNFASTGLLVFGANNSRFTNNTFRDNEFSMYLGGSNNRATGNRVSSGIVSQSSLNFKAYGALIGGDGNHLAGNQFRADNGTGAVGIYILPGTSVNRVTGNRISGFEFPLFDGGDDSMIRGTPAGNPAPPSGR